MNLASYIDHTLLNPTATKAEITSLCETAIEHQFKAVCIPESYLELGSEVLGDSSVALCTVIGFPLGYDSTAVKVFQTKTAIAKGATEVDMVINQGWFQAGDYNGVTTEIAAVKQATQGCCLKVIIETANLHPTQIARAASCVLSAGADFVKTSTGFASRGASLEDIAILQAQVGGKIGIKASGGIKTHNQAMAMIEAGATRIGTSNGAALLKP